jgi:hypothetical protein
MAETTFTTRKAQGLQVQTGVGFSPSGSSETTPGSLAPVNADAVNSVLEAIHSAQSILVSSHARPDGDAIGSMLACGMLLEQMDKHVSRRTPHRQH